MKNEIKLLPVNSFELEQHLTDVGLSLLSFAKEYNFSEKCVGVKDCDFIQSVIIEFISEIKIDFIAYHAVHKAKSAGVANATILATEHGPEVLAEAAIHAQQVGILTDNFMPDLRFKIRYAFNRAKKEFINAVYQWKVQSRQKRAKASDVPKAAPGQYKVLMSTFHPGTISTLTPVQDRLLERPDVHQLYIANRLETYNKLVKMGYRNVINAWGMDQAKHNKLNLSVLKVFLEDFFDQAFPFGNATPHFKSRFYRTLKLKLKFAVSLYTSLRVILNEYEPDSIVLSSSSPIDAQLMVHLASAKDVKIIEVTHGLFQETPILKFQNIPIKLVWNQFQCDLMKMYKGDIQCIIVGNPKHDLLLKKFEENSPENYLDRPYLLFATTPGNNNNISATTYLKILTDFVNAAQQNSEMLFVLKLHPTEIKTKVIEECKRIGFPDNLIVEQSKDIYELIYHAEAVMVVTSTVSYEALLFNKKIITYTVENSERWVPFSKFGLATDVNSTQGIIQAIKIFSESSSSHLINDKRSYFTFSDGHAVDKTICIILSK